MDEVIKILEIVKARVTDDSIMDYSGYDSPKLLRDKIDEFIDYLRKGDTNCLSEIHTHFLPTVAFQEHSIPNGWADEYLE